MKKILTLAGACLFIFCSIPALAQLHPAKTKLVIKKVVHTLLPVNLSSAGTNNTTSCIVDTIVLTSQAQIDNFSTNYPSCTTPKYLIIDGAGASPAITNLVGLGGITEVINKLQISNTSILNLVDLGSLTSVGDTLELDHNHSMVALELGNMQQLGAFILIDLPLLTDIDGISDHLHVLNGDLHIDSTALTNLGGFANIDSMYRGMSISHTPIHNYSNLVNLVYIQDYFHMDSDTLLTSIGLNNLHHTVGFLFANLPQLTTLAGLTDHLDNKDIYTFWMIATGLPDLTGLDSLHSSSNFYIWSNPNLTSLHGLEGLTGNIDGGISLSDNQQLVGDFSALSNITDLQNGTLEITSMPSTDLTGLGNLTHIGKGLFVTYNYNMTSLNGLNDNLVIENRTDYNAFYDSVRIYWNSQLATCTSLPLCHYISIDGRADIRENAPGCSSLGEAAAYCGVIIGNPCGSFTDVTWNGQTSDDWDDSTNWSPSVVPGLCNNVIIPADNSVPNSPYVYNHNINIGGLTMEFGSLFDLNSFNLNIGRQLNLVYGGIFNGNNIICSGAYQPHVEGTYMEGNFSCLNYGGESIFYFNSIVGNTILSDSIGRTENSQTFVNQFHGNLTIINNSENGQMYLGNASPGFDVVEGNLTAINNTNDAGISLGLGGSDALHVQGNVTITANNNAYVGIQNILLEDGGYDQHIKQGGTVPVSIETLIMNTYHYLVLDNDVHITNWMQFGDFCGNVVTAPNKLLIFENNTFAQSGYASGIAIGPVKKVGNQAFTFPIGSIEQATEWKAPMDITAPAQPTDEFTAQYFHHDPSLDGYDTAQCAIGSGGISGKEYWGLVRNNGNSKVKVTLQYEQNRSGTYYLYQYMQPAAWGVNNINVWKVLGSAGFSGNINGGSVQSLDSIAQGPVTLSKKPMRIPIINIAGADTIIKCLNTGFNVPYIADTAFVANNYIRVEVSDTLGNFNTFFNPTFGYKYTSLAVDSIPFLSYALLPGKYYKIRMIGNLPPDTSVNTKTLFFIDQPSYNYYTVIGPNPACANVIQKYYPSAHQPGMTYSWSLPNGGGTFTTSGDTAFVTWTVFNDARYLVSTVSNSCNTVPKYTYININAPGPTATASINNTGRWLYAASAPANAGYQWYKNTVLIAGATNSSYYASLAGSYTVRYANNCGSGPVSNTITFGANSIAQTISFGGISNKTFGDAPFTPAATSTSGLPVSFSIVSGPATVNSQTNLITIIGTGLVTVQANQSGDNVYDTAAPVIQMFTVNKASQTITFNSIGAQNYGGAPVTLSATSTSGLPITYSVVSGPATVAGNILTLTGIGTITVRASQPGDANYFAATPSDVIFCSSVDALNPIAGFTNLCPGTATYSVNNITGAVYNWRIIGGSTLPSTTSTANVTWTVPGTYYLLVSATGNCGAASINDTLTVNVINSIQPDSVQSMYPTNGAINQQLPLTLSWVPAHPEAFYTFDLYLWKAEDPQPSTPYASNIQTVNYTIPLNSGLVYNHPYKWMVVSHNGSCTIIHTGPVQQFSLIPLPDLVVSNVQIPSSAFSGQTISINWTVTNPGPGKTTTNQSWTDAVFLSFDTIPNFVIPPNFNPNLWSYLQLPVRPLLVGTKPNVTALDSGQHYTNSINFTLPVNYSQPLYAYVITNYPAGANAPVQVTVANDTARAPQPINVILSPTPDLRVDTVFTPTTTFSGSTINLTYKVKNYGVLTPAGTGWYDRMYISQSPLFNINTAIPVKYPKGNGTYYANAFDAYNGNSSQLQADSFYTRNMQIVIPNYIFGAFYIYVVTNSGDLLYEGSLNNNNVGRSQLQVFLTPTPHLTVSSLDVPVSTASVSQPIGVNWNISNTGFNDNIEKNKGHYFVQTGTCFIPPPPCILPDNCSNCFCPPPPPPTPGISIGDSVSFGSSYWIDKVYLSTDPAGLNVANARLVSQADQGIINAGLYVDDNFNTTYPCQVIGTNPSVHDVNTGNVIKPGSNHPKSVGFTIPVDLTEGNYYVYVLTNSTKTVYEYPGTIETRRSALPISIVRPDATVSNLTVPANAVGGQSLAINYSILNIGQGGVYNVTRRDRIYVSSSAVFDVSAQLVGTNSFTENLPVGTAVQHTFNYAFPVATSGQRYFYVHTNYDSSFRETNMNNNISAAAPTSVVPATANDLVVSSIQLSDTVYSSYTSHFKYTVSNNGAGHTAGTWKDSIFISCSSTYNPGTSYFVAERSHSEFVANGGSYSDSFDVNMPYSFIINNCFPQTTFNTAYFYIKTNADNIVYEGSNGNNNVTASGSRVLLNPLEDLIVTAVTGADSATVGRPYNLGWTGKNIGYYPGLYYAGWYDAPYFSPDSTLNGNAVQVGYYPEYSQLLTNQSYTESKTLTTPNLPTGDYYVFVKTNNYGTINSEIAGNNTNLIRNGAGVAKKIHVVQPLLPDLTDSILAIPSLVATGQPLTLVHRISNKGVGVTYPINWTNDVWLSADFIPGNANDVLLSSKTHSGALQVNQSYDDTVSAIIALNIVPGNYVLISRVNATGNVFESNNNNNLAFRYVTVYSPAPSDLVVANITKPDTVFLGYTLDTAKWVVSNTSTNAATGVSSDGIYLSKSSVLDSTAILLGIKTKMINMAPLGKDTISLQPLVNNVIEGNYNVIVKTDLLNNIVESDKNNNTGVAASQVYVGVKELPLNVLTPNTLYNINRFYKLIIPDSLNGATIQVVLKSNDSLSVKNQMFIGKGYIPSAANF
ncbi:MAG: CARDB domain-containing protein, partial [Ferruginibacter sp.]